MSQGLVIDVVLLLAAYTIGAFPTGLLVGKIFAKTDVREHGSKNIGATNVWRVLGWKCGLFTFIIDVGKAAGSVWLAAFYWQHVIPWLPIFAGVAVLLGNLFNIFLGFKGGKGVAAGLGVFLALAPKSVGIALLLFIIVVGIWKYISLGSIVAAASLPILLFVFQGSGAMFVTSILIAAFVIWKHRANIRRLIDGTENKITRKKETAAETPPAS